MVHSLSPNVLLAWNSHEKSSTSGSLGGRFNNSIRLCKCPTHRDIIQSVIDSVRFVMDAQGSGYSQLEPLKQFPLSSLVKIKWPTLFVEIVEIC